jgi:hypothetical protein
VFDEFTNDHHMHLSWARQVLLGDVPGRDFVEPGMPLTIAFSAVAQMLAPHLLSELILCVGALAAAAALTYWLCTRFTGSWRLGLAAAALQIAFTPRLYNYPKILVPLVALLLIWRYLERPLMHRAAAMGVWLAVGFLFRHDQLVYLSPVMLFVLATSARSPDGSRLRHLAACAASAFVLVLPYLVMLQLTSGIPAHIRDGMEFAGGEQWGIDSPEFAVASPTPAPGALATAGPLRTLARSAFLRVVSTFSPIVNRDNALAVLFWIAFAVPALLALLALGIVAGSPRPRTAVREMQALCLALQTLVLAFAFFRAPIRARLEDAAGPLVLLIAVASFVLWRRQSLLRICGVGLFFVAALAIVLHGNVWSRLYAAGITRGASAVVTQISTQVRTLRTWPFESAWPSGTLPPAIRYIDACTQATDRTLVTWFAPEVHVFARRGFAAGHAYLIGRSFYSNDYQDDMLKRLAGQRVPVVLINARERSWLATRFLRLDAYLASNYRAVGSYRQNDGAEIGVAVRRDLPPSGVHPATGWPCFR